MKKKSSVLEFVKEVTKVVYNVGDQYIEWASLVCWVGIGLKVISFAISKILGKLGGEE